MVQKQRQLSEVCSSSADYCQKRLKRAASVWRTCLAVTPIVPSGHSVAATASTATAWMHGSSRPHLALSARRMRDQQTQEQEGHLVSFKTSCIGRVTHIVGPPL